MRRDQTRVRRGRRSGSGRGTVEDLTRGQSSGTARVRNCREHLSIKVDRKHFEALVDRFVARHAGSPVCEDAYAIGEHVLTLFRGVILQPQRPN